MCSIRSQCYACLDSENEESAIGTMIIIVRQHCMIQGKGRQTRMHNPMVVEILMATATTTTKSLVFLCWIYRSSIRSSSIFWMLMSLTHSSLSMIIMRMSSVKKRNLLSKLPQIIHSSYSGKISYAILLISTELLKLQDSCIRCIGMERILDRILAKITII